MRKKKVNFSFKSSGIHCKLRVAFCLMSVLPLLVTLYIASTYIFPRVGFKADVTLALLTIIFIIIIGFFILREIFSRIQAASENARLLAKGDWAGKIETGPADEVGDLGEALNDISRFIRNNMDEIKKYGDKTNEINTEIQNRVFVLSSLLQIESLITQGASLEEVLKFIVEKSRLLADSEISFLFLRDDTQDFFYMKAQASSSNDNVSDMRIDSNDKILGKLTSGLKLFISDHSNTITKEAREELSRRFNIENAFILPIPLKGRIVAILGIGNNKNNFVFKKEDQDLLEIFAKQIAIAVENNRLLRQVERLEIKDALTGLYNEAFIRNRLQEEIKRAIMLRRSCAFIIFNVDNFHRFHQNFGLLQAETALKKIAFIVRDSVSEIDCVARLGDNEFALVLPEKNKRNARDLAEEIRKKIEFIFSEEPDMNKRFTVSGGVSENPLDGIEAEELIAKAKEALSFAKAQGKNTIIS